MVTAEEIVEELKTLGSDTIKKVLLNHGVQEPFFGVKIEDLKKIQKRIKKDYQLALDLYDTGIYDAMYLAGLIADDAKMTKKDLQQVAGEGALAHAQRIHRPVGRGRVASTAGELALEWIESPRGRRRRRRLGDAQQPGVDHARRRPRPGRAEQLLAPRGGDDPRPARTASATR